MRRRIKLLATLAFTINGEKATIRLREDDPTLNSRDVCYTVLLTTERTFAGQRGNGGRLRVCGAGTTNRVFVGRPIHLLHVIAQKALRFQFDENDDKSVRLFQLAANAISLQILDDFTE